MIIGAVSASNVRQMIYAHLILPDTQFRIINNNHDRIELRNRQTRPRYITQRYRAYAKGTQTPLPDHKHSLITTSVSGLHVSSIPLPWALSKCPYCGSTSGSIPEAICAGLYSSSCSSTSVYLLRASSVLWQAVALHLCSGRIQQQRDVCPWDRSSVSTKSMAS